MNEILRAHRSRRQWRMLLAAALAWGDCDGGRSDNALGQNQKSRSRAQTKARRQGRFGEKFSRGAQSSPAASAARNALKRGVVSNAERQNLSRRQRWSDARHRSGRAVVGAMICDVCRKRNGRRVPASRAWPMGDAVGNRNRQCRPSGDVEVVLLASASPPHFRARCGGRAVRPHLRGGEFVMVRTHRPPFLR